MNASTPRPPNPAALALAWVGTPAAVARQLEEPVACYEDSDDFLLDLQAFDHEVYVIQFEQRGVRGIDLVRLIRRRTAAAVLVLADDTGPDFIAALESGADMVLRPAAPGSHLRAAVAALRRRVQRAVPPGAQASASPTNWTLEEAQALLRAPDGTPIPLSDSDLAIMRCFAAAEGGQVARQTLVEQLWGAAAGVMDNALHATMYRLRKRIEQSGQPLAPVHAVSRVGYEFRAPLSRA